MYGESEGLDRRWRDFFRFRELALAAVDCGRGSEEDRRKIARADSRLARLDAFYERASRKYVVVKGTTLFATYYGRSDDRNARY